MSFKCVAAARRRMQLEMLQFSAALCECRKISNAYLAGSARCNDLKCFFGMEDSENKRIIPTSCEAAAYTLCMHGKSLTIP